jgi:hypothetical protein
MGWCEAHHQVSTPWKGSLYHITYSAEVINTTSKPPTLRQIDETCFEGSVKTF